MATMREEPLSRHERLTYLAMRADAREHERASHRSVARRLAALLGVSFHEHGLADGTLREPPGYVVPDQTLTSPPQAQRLGIASDRDLFGGIVPYPFVATKSITHPLVSRQAVAPHGWQPAFAEQVARDVLPGYSTFSLDDARSAGLQLLRGGAVRIKPAEGIGGSGQQVASSAEELEAALAALPAHGADPGLVLERQLAEIRTFSVGWVRVGQRQISYVGTQRTTRSRRDEEVYGGSSILAVPGGFDALADLDVEPAFRRAIRQARVYHEAAFACFEAMIASRCNYDVAEGHDAAGCPQAGVLEQSWRIGGASGAEVAALEAFAADPSLRSVRASTVEVHAAGVAVPAGAIVGFQGVDEELGPITKYSKVDDE